jgi:hypothetical protein
MGNLNIKMTSTRQAGAFLMIRSLLTATIACSLATLLPGGTACADEPARELFNGKDLDGWDGLPGVWSVEDGVIVGRTTADAPIEANTFLVLKEKVPSDFRLTLEYKIEGGNSGIQYRSRVVDPKKWIVGGYQADIDSGINHSGIMYEERGRGILTKRGQRVHVAADGSKSVDEIADATELQKSIHGDDWNTYVIEAIGPRLKHTINDQLMSETEDLDPKKASRDGVIAVQVHTGPPMTVRFRSIRLEALAPTAEESDHNAGAEAK